MCNLPSHDVKAGIPKMLADSAVYPRAFGDAVAQLMQPRGARPDTIPDLNAYTGQDDMGALDDFLKGSRNTWWRGQ